MSRARTEPLSFHAWRNRELATRDLVTGLLPQLLLFLFTYHGWTPSSQDVSSTPAVPWLQAAHGFCSDHLTAGGPDQPSSGVAGSLKRFFLRGLCGPLMQHHPENLVAVILLIVPILIWLISRRLYYRWRTLLLGMSRLVPMLVLVADIAASSPEQFQRRLTTSYMFCHPKHERALTALFPGWTGWQVHQWLTPIAMWWEGQIQPLSPRAEMVLSWPYALGTVYAVSSANAALGCFSWVQTLLFAAFCAVLMCYLPPRAAAQLEARMRQQYAAAMAAAGAGGEGAGVEGTSSTSASSSQAVAAGGSNAKGKGEVDDDDASADEQDQDQQRLLWASATAAAAAASRRAGSAHDVVQPTAQQQPQPRGLPAPAPAQDLRDAAPGDAGVTPAGGAGSSKPSTLYVASGHEQQPSGGGMSGRGSQVCRSGQRPPAQGGAGASSGSCLGVSLLRHAPLCLLAGEAGAAGQEVQLHLLLRQASGTGGEAPAHVRRGGWSRQDSAADHGSSDVGMLDPTALAITQDHEEAQGWHAEAAAAAYVEGGDGVEQYADEAYMVPPIMPWQRQVRDLAGCLGDLVVSLVAGGDVAASWAWVEAELLSLLQAQHEERLEAGACEGDMEGWPLILDLQLPASMAAGCDELRVMHYPPGSPSACVSVSSASSPSPMGSPRAPARSEQQQQPQQALEGVEVAQVLLCAVPEAAWREVHQVLLPGMMAEAQSFLLLHQQHSGRRAGSAAAVEEEALQLVWHHWCSLCGDMRRLIDLAAQHAATTDAASLSSTATGAARPSASGRQASVMDLMGCAPHTKPHQREAEAQQQVERSTQEGPNGSSNRSSVWPALLQVAHHLLNFLGQHRLSCCAEFVVGLLPAELGRPWMAAYNRQLAAAAEQQEVWMALQAHHLDNNSSCAAGGQQPGSVPTQWAAATALGSQQQQQQQQQPQVVPVQQVVVLAAGSTTVIRAVPMSQAALGVTVTAAAGLGVEGLSPAGVQGGCNGCAAAGGTSGNMEVVRPEEAQEPAGLPCAAAAAGPACPHTEVPAGVQCSSRLPAAQDSGSGVPAAAGSSRTGAGPLPAADQAFGAAATILSREDSGIASSSSSGSGTPHSTDGNSSTPSEWREDCGRNSDAGGGGDGASLRHALTSCSASSMHGSSGGSATSQGCGWSCPESWLKLFGAEWREGSVTDATSAAGAGSPAVHVVATLLSSSGACSSSSSTAAAQPTQVQRSMVRCGTRAWAAAAVPLLVAALLAQLLQAGGLPAAQQLCAGSCMLFGATVAVVGGLAFILRMLVDRRACAMALLLVAAVSAPMALAAFLAAHSGW